MGKAETRAAERLASFSGHGTRVISLGDDGADKVWDIGQRKLVASYP